MCASFKSTFTALRGSFLPYLKFSQIKEGATNSAEQLNYLVLLSVFKVLRTQILRHSLDFNAFCMIQNTFFRVLKFLQIKEGGPNFWGESILENGWIIWSPLLYFNFKSFKDANYLSFIRFQCMLHDSGVLFWELWNFYKLKRGDLISGENQFCRTAELFGRSFCISMLKVSMTQILHHSLDFKTFHMMREYFSETIQISTNSRGGT